MYCVQVIHLITEEIMPVLHESGMAGRVEYVSHLPLFIEHPRATMMLIDVLTDRGFSVSHTADVSHVPQSIDLTTGEVRNRQETKHRCGWVLVVPTLSEGTVSAVARVPLLWSGGHVLLPTMPPDRAVDHLQVSG